MGESYGELFLGSVFHGANPAAFLSLFFLFMARILPIIAQAPFFGAKVLPHTTKMVLAIALFAIFMPKLLVIVKVPPTFDVHLILLILKEMTIGTVLGYLITVPFNIVQIAGIVVDHQRGGASLMVNDPAIQSQSSPLGTLYNLVLIYIFYIIDGPFLFIDALVTSYDVLPPDQYFNPLLTEKGSLYWKVTMNLLSKTMIIATQLASPALIAILMTDLFLGIANRLAPQVQVTFLGLPLKSLLGLTAVTLGWSLFTEQIAKESLSWLQMMTELIYSFKQGP